MPQHNAIQPAAVAPPARPVSPIAVVPVSRMQGAFENAANAPREATAETRGALLPATSGAPWDVELSPVALSSQGWLPFNTSGWDAQIPALRCWVQTGHASEDRMGAFTQIRRCVANTCQDNLDIAGRQLRNLPPIPEWVRVFECGNNELRTLPRLPPLQVLDVSGNPLEDGAAAHPWPDTLRILNLSGCGQSQLPLRLPSELLYFRFENNQLTSLPPDFAGPAWALQEIYLHGNPLDAQTREWIDTWNASHARPRIILEPFVGYGEVSSPPAAMR